MRIDCVLGTSSDAFVGTGILDGTQQDLTETVKSCLYYIS